MKTLVTLLVVAVAIMGTACSSFDVSSDFNPETDFSKFRSFAIKKDIKIPGDALAENAFTRDRVYIAIERSLITRGFTLAEDGSADLVILAYAGVQDKVNLSTYGYSASPYYGGYYGGAYGGAYSTQTVVTHYNEGTLHIDILDAKEKALVWKGQGTGVIEKARSPKEREDMVNEAVLEILANFPPQ